MDNYISAATYIFAKNKEGEWNILCGKRSGNNPFHQGGLFNVPVGMKDYPNEGIIDCARRECYEETCLNISPSLFKFVGSEIWGEGKTGANFLVIFNDGTKNHVPKKGDWENDLFQWIPVSEIGNLNWAYGMGNTAISIYKSNIENKEKMLQEKIRKEIKQALKKYELQL